ncbi:hypothetical protein ACFL47_03290 [Candidatus Latescibacterota bacterium]
MIESIPPSECAVFLLKPEAETPHYTVNVRWLDDDGRLGAKTQRVFLH